MRFIILLLLSFLSLSSSACDCDFNVTALYQKANFVGVIKILKNNLNEVDSIPSYKIDVSVSKLYKGDEIKLIYARGFNTLRPQIATSCDFWLSAGKEYLVFGFMENGKLTTSSCSVLSESKFAYNYDQELEFLKKKLGSYISDSPFSRSNLFYIPFKIFKNYPKEVQGKDYFVKISINKEMEIDKIELLSNFDEEIRERLITDIKKVDVKKQLADRTLIPPFSFVTKFIIFNIP